MRSTRSPTCSPLTLVAALTRPERRKKPCKRAALGRTGDAAIEVATVAELRRVRLRTRPHPRPLRRQPRGRSRAPAPASRSPGRETLTPSRAVAGGGLGARTRCADSHSNGIGRVAVGRSAPERGSGTGSLRLSYLVRSPRSRAVLGARGRRKFHVRSVCRTPCPRRGVAVGEPRLKNVPTRSR